ncbi:MAG: glutathione S-transferase [Betaproteobacteria bacterium]|jgi:glutathione S-transferase|nr:glutathione S-transferase [Betaproteobacteria bacterium]MEA3157276.1 glutathione S-transferase [Betaproteobacteria bacterium]
MLKIWGRTNSINVQKVLWCCGELGLHFERIDAGMQFGVNNTPEYKTLNPNGLVPTISDDGFVLWESHAIVRYLSRKQGVGTLWPADAHTATSADRWMEWYSTTMWLNLRPVFWNLVRTAPEKRNMTEVEESRKRLAANLAIVDAQLAGAEYIAGESFTMADIPMGVAAYRWFSLPIERPSMPHFERWYKRICERPAFRQHCMLPLT